MNRLAAITYKQQNGTIYEKQECADSAVSDDHESDGRFEYSGTNRQIGPTFHATHTPRSGTAHAGSACAGSTRAGDTNSPTARASCANAAGSARAAGSTG